MHSEEIVWNNPKTKLPETKQTVLFKVVILHNQKIKHGRFEDNTFFDSDAAGLAYDAKDVFGWVPFIDSNERKIISALRRNISSTSKEVELMKAECTSTKKLRCAKPSWLAAETL